MGWTLGAERFQLPAGPADGLVKFHGAARPPAPMTRGTRPCAAPTASLAHRASYCSGAAPVLLALVQGAAAEADALTTLRPSLLPACAGAFAPTAAAPAPAPACDDGCGASTCGRRRQARPFVFSHVGASSTQDGTHHGARTGHWLATQTGQEGRGMRPRRAYETPASCPGPGGQKGRLAVTRGTTGDRQPATDNRPWRGRRSGSQAGRSRATSAATGTPAQHVVSSPPPPPHRRWVGHAPRRTAVAAARAHGCPCPVARWRLLGRGGRTCLEHILPGVAR